MYPLVKNTSVPWLKIPLLYNQKYLPYFEMYTGKLTFVQCRFCSFPYEVFFVHLGIIYVKFLSKLIYLFIYLFIS